MNIIGIDFGTSYTYIYEQRDGKKPTVIAEDLRGDYNKSYGLVVGREKGIKTVIGMSRSGAFFVGHEVESSKSNGLIINDNEHPNIVADLKSKLRDSAGSADKFENFPAYKFNYPELKEQGIKLDYTYAELAVEFLKEIFKWHMERESGFRLGDYQRIVIGMPSVTKKEVNNGSRISTTEQYKEFLKEKVLQPLVSIDEANWFNSNIDIRINEEPVLAGYAYLGQNHDFNPRCMLVVDIGGGTADYAFVERDGNNNLTTTDSDGGTDPSGSEFDQRLSSLIYEKYGIEPDYVDVSDAKEKLFKAKKEYIYTLKAQKIYVDGDAYKSYLERGRRCLYLHREPNKSVKVKIAFNRKALGEFKLHPYSNSFGWKEDDSVLFEQYCEETSENFSNKIQKYVEDSNRGDSFDTILFVGGSTHIFELRDAICRKLGLISKSGHYETGKTYKRDERDIHVIFTTEYNDEITCSNAIALGALYVGQQEQNITPVTPMSIFFNGSNPATDKGFLMLNTEVWKNNLNKRSLQNLAIFNTKKHWDKLIPHSREPEKRWVRFKIKLGTSVYPKRDSSYFRFAINEPRNEESKLYLFAHRRDDSSIYLYIFNREDDGNAKLTYTFTDYLSHEHPKVFENVLVTRNGETVDTDKSRNGKIDQLRYYRIAYNQKNQEEGNEFAITSQNRTSLKGKNHNCWTIELKGE